MFEQICKISKRSLHNTTLKLRKIMKYATLHFSDLGVASESQDMRDLGYTSPSLNRGNFG